MNYLEAKKTLTNYLSARIPFILIETMEKNRGLKLLKDIEGNEQLNIFIHSMSNGMINTQNNELVSNEKTFIGTLSFIASELKTKRNLTFVLTDIDEINEDNVASRYLRDIVRMCEEKSCSIILITDKEVNLNLRMYGMTIELEYPNEKEILELLHNFMDKYKNEIDIKWNENDYKEAAVILLGLSEIEIKNIISILISKRSIVPEDLVNLKYAKSHMFSNMEGLEKVENIDVVYAGLDNLKKWLKSKKKLLEIENKEKLVQRGIKPPRGILVVGVPGCGKSLTAKAVSKIWDLPLFLLDLATVQSMYVGQTEERFRNALKMAEHVAPCILWIDEIEKGLSGIKDSNGVTSKMVGQFLYWLQECDKEVFVVATANDVESLPAELLRKGRFDEMFFVDLPNKNERKELLALYFAKYIGIKLDENILEELSSTTEGFASSDIEASIRDISYNVVSDNIRLTKQYIIDYFSKSSSISKINPEKIEKIRNWGKDRTINASSN